MYLGLNTFIYEITGHSLVQGLQKGGRFGFKYFDIPVFDSNDRKLASKDARMEIKRTLHGEGLVPSQVLLLDTSGMSSGSRKVREGVLDFMKRGADFQLEIGGKQVLICWGCGIYEHHSVKTEAWLNSVHLLRRFAEWGGERGLLIELELDPHVYFVVNNLQKMVAMIEDAGAENIFANMDIGHLWINRESPHEMEKLRGRILHVHISDTDSYVHNNCIIGAGNADIVSYTKKIYEMKVHGSCMEHEVSPVACIEIGDPGSSIHDPDSWVGDSLSYVRRVLPELAQQ
jgi:sugar phosphate isomerase/epimerase